MSLIKLYYFCILLSLANTDDQIIALTSQRTYIVDEFWRERQDCGRCGAAHELLIPAVSNDFSVLIYWWVAILTIGCNISGGSIVGIFSVA